jgi:hypothetical protein
MDLNDFDINQPTYLESSVYQLLEVVQPTKTVALLSQTGWDKHRWICNTEKNMYPTTTLHFSHVLVGFSNGMSTMYMFFVHFFK